MLATRTAGSCHVQKSLRPVVLQPSDQGRVQLVPTVALFPVPLVVVVDRVVVGDHAILGEVVQFLVVHAARADHLGRNLEAACLAEGLAVVVVEAGTGVVADFGVDQRGSEGGMVAERVGHARCPRSRRTSEIRGTARRCPRVRSACRLRRSGETPRLDRMDAPGDSPAAKVMPLESASSRARSGLG